jgi:hypothetical protein
MIANGLPAVIRHSTVCTLELNGSNQIYAAGSLAAKVRVLPTETVSRRSSSLISTEKRAFPGQSRVVLPSSWLGLPIMRQSFGAVELYWLLMVWAFAHEAANAATKTIVGANMTRMHLRRLQPGEGSEGT